MRVICRRAHFDDSHHSVTCETVMTQRVLLASHAMRAAVLLHRIMLLVPVGHTRSVVHPGCMRTQK